MADSHGGAGVGEPRARSAAPVIAACTVLMVVASGLSLGIPNLGAAVQLLNGGYPTIQSAIALSSAISYAVVLVAAGISVTGALTTGVHAWRKRPGLRAVILFAAGAILLTLSLVSRLESGSGICCGSGTQQVREVVSLAH